ncbi:MAG: 3-hydroxybutyryl-CoA dehydrogenase [Chitinophagales bacterium]|nr:MAG: 3-hydroxybutyryl-CoA dehydrogenase [Chitinophagales bacterium]
MIRTPETIKKVLIIGSGTMGLRIGLQCALKGYAVCLYDLHESALQQAVRVQSKLLNWLIKDGRITDEQAKAAQLRITCTTDPLRAAEDADFVSESVLEDRNEKKAVYRQFAPLLPKNAIITTNTSYMLPSWFAEDSGNPSRFCAFHFHDVFVANVVDIMPHAGTDPRVVELLQALARRLDQVPIVVEKESHGYVFNAMLGVLLGAAGALVTSGVASIEDVDRSWMINMQTAIGPFGIMDSIGLDTVWHVTKAYKDEKSVRFAKWLKEYVDAGKLGIKTGEGFYRYPDPAFKNPEFLK